MTSTSRFFSSVLAATALAGVASAQQVADKACLPSIADAVTTDCIEASTNPTLGMLYPLSPDFFIDSLTRFVGIGTLSPQFPLHVAGSARFDQPGGGQIKLEQNGTAPAVTGITPNGVQSGLQFFDIGAGLGPVSDPQRMMLRTNGRLGLGTLAPIADFDIENRVWAGGNPFGLGEGAIMTRHPNEMRAAYVGPFSSTQYTIGMHDNSGLFVTGGILHDATTDETSIYADVKNFRQTNPADPETDIVYACVEGPEAAAYARGTATLVAGQAYVTLPEHFQAVASNKGMTVHVTPRSATSRGLAVTERSASHIVVAELLQGQGNYEFDWEVKVVRKGFEDYKVIRPKLRSLEVLPVPVGR